MNKFTVLALLFLVIAILNFTLGILNSAKNEAPAWLYFFAGFCFLVGGAVWLLKSRSKTE